MLMEPDTVAMMMRNPVSVELLRRLIRYDPETGHLFWLWRPNSVGSWNNTWAGKRCSAVNKDGYARVGIDTRYYLAHRVAWALHYGEWPAMELDHINGDKLDNRIVNLRLTARAENMRNCRLYRKNKTGFMGVIFTGKRWRAQIREKGQMMHLGTFDTLEEAAAVRKAAEARLGYHPNHGRRVNDGS